MNQVMRRKPSASHCVKNPSFEAYRPSSLVFCFGRMRDTVSSLNRCGTLAIQRLSRLSSYSPCASVQPSSATDTNSISSPSSSNGAPVSDAAGFLATSRVARTSA